jgi:hypothetical protein
MSIRQLAGSVGEFPFRRSGDNAVCTGASLQVIPEGEWPVRAVALAPVGPQWKPENDKRGSATRQRRHEMPGSGQVLGLSPARPTRTTTPDS